MKTLNSSRLLLVTSTTADNHQAAEPMGVTSFSRSFELAEASQSPALQCSYEGLPQTSLPPGLPLITNQNNLETSADHFYSSDSNVDDGGRSAIVSHGTTIFTNNNNVSSVSRSDDNNILRNGDPRKTKSMDFYRKQPSSFTHLNGEDEKESYGVSVNSTATTSRGIKRSFKLDKSADFNIFCDGNSGTENSKSLSLPTYFQSDNSKILNCDTSQGNKACVKYKHSNEQLSGKEVCRSELFDMFVFSKDTLPIKTRSSQSRYKYRRFVLDPIYHRNEFISSEPSRLSQLAPDGFRNLRNYSSDLMNRPLSSNKDLSSIHDYSRVFHSEPVQSKAKKHHPSLSTANTSIAHSKSEPRLRAWEHSIVGSNDDNVSQSESVKFDFFGSENIENLRQRSSKRRTLSQPVIFKNENETLESSKHDKKSFQTSNSDAKHAIVSQVPSFYQTKPYSSSYDNLHAKGVECLSANSPSSGGVLNEFGRPAASVNTLNDIGVNKPSLNLCEQRSVSEHIVCSSSKQSTHDVPLQCRSMYGSTEIFSVLDEVKPLLGGTLSVDKRHKRSKGHSVSDAGKNAVEVGPANIQLRVQCATDEEDSNEDTERVQEIFCSQTCTAAAGDACPDVNVHQNASSRRKRKFRRKGSLQLISNSFFPKSKNQGKMTKLCKQRKNYEAVETTKAFNVIVTAEKKLHSHNHNQQVHQVSSPSNNPTNIPSYCNQCHTHQHLIHLQRPQSFAYPTCSESILSYGNHNTWTAPSCSHKARGTRVTFSHLNGHGGSNESHPEDTGISRSQGLKTARAPKPYSSSNSLTSSNGCLSSSRPCHPAVQDLRRVPRDGTGSKHIPRCLSPNDKRRGEHTLVDDLEPPVSHGYPCRTKGLDPNRKPP
ncbi:hypothetical protein PoB_002237200 [Plakobranchus ocellatus]|uniref:Uncharacterized protein n=1 Tax=Plakobranchus ocellatus TaxID=259542 RepID=A0AAV3ZKS7_9GAST|nr:hypothetical protein PoB_002237200 [Plakobranchus ocellatus]